MPAKARTLRAAAALAATVAALVGPGCDRPRPLDDDALILADPSKRHPISAEVQVASLDVAVSHKASGLDSLTSRRRVSFANTGAMAAARSRLPFRIVMAVPRRAGSRPSVTSSTRMACRRARCASSTATTGSRRLPCPSCRLPRSRQSAVIGARMSPAVRRTGPIRTSVAPRSAISLK